MDLLIVVAVGLVVGTVAYPVLASSKTSGKDECINNLKTMGFALAIYSSENGSEVALPPADRWFDASKKDSLLKALPHCPNSKVVGIGGYAFNSNLSGTALLHTMIWGQFPMVYDSDSLGPNPHDAFSSLPEPGRHNGRNHVVFGDCHARSVSAAEAKALPRGPS